MIETALQVSFDVSGPTPAQRALAIGFVALFFVVLTIATYRLQFLEFTPRMKREKSILQGQREDQTPESVRLENGTAREEMESVIYDLFTRDTEHGEPTTFREAADRIGVGWKKATAGIPGKVLGMLEEAVIIAVLGAILFIPIETWRRYFTSSPGYPDMGAIIDLSVSFLEFGTQTAATFPFAGFLFDLAFAYAMLAAEWLYHAWYVSSLVLVLAALSIWALDRYLPEEAKSYRIVPDYYFVGTVAAIATLIVWTIGASIAWIGQLIGVVSIAGRSLNVALAMEVIGFLLALAALSLFVYLAAKEVYYRADRATRRFSDMVGHSVLVPLYLVLQRASVVFALLLAPYVLLYFVMAIATGRVWEVWGAFAEGSTDVQLLVGAAVLALFAAFSFVIRDEWTYIRTAMSEAWTRKRVRLALFNRALPVGFMIFAYILAWSFGESFILALVLAILVGIGVRLLAVLFYRAKYRTKVWEGSETVPRSVLIQAYRLHDSEGDDLYYSRVNGEELAYDTLDGIVRHTADACEDLFEDGAVAPSVASWHADHMFRFGITETEETRHKLVDKLRRDTYGWLKRRDGVAAEEKYDRRLEKYPESILSKKLREWRIHGTDEGRIVRDDGYVYLVS